VLAAHVGIDVPAVGRIAEADDFRAQRAKDRRTRRTGRPVGGVERDAPAFQRSGGKETQGHRDIFLRGAGHRLGRRGVAERRRCGRKQLLDFQLLRFRQLSALRAKKFDAVVGGRIMRGRDHDSQRGARRADLSRHRRRGQHAERPDRPPFRRQSGGDRPFERRARLPGVPADEHRRTTAATRPRPPGQPASGRDAQPGNEGFIDLGAAVRAADAVRSEIAALDF